MAIPASVIGSQFHLDQLVPLMEDFSEDQVPEALETALSARVIEELAGPSSGFQFSHALVQHTLADELSKTSRTRLHARIARVLEKLYASDGEPHAAELAYHFAEAELILGSGKLVRYSLLAGDSSLAT